MKIPSSASQKTFAFYGLLLYAGLLLFSVAYQSIAPGLDPSWGYALNRFAHGPEIFGKDIVLTYGPLGYLAVPEYLGGNIYIALVAHVGLCGLLLFFLVFLWESGQAVAAAFLTCALIVSNKLYVIYWDYLLIAAILAAFTILLEKPRSSAILAALPVLTGLTFLVKFNSYIAAMLLLGWYIAGRIAHRLAISRSEIAALSVTLVSGPVSYLIYHPSLTDLVGYSRGSLEMASGYSTTMATPGESDTAWKIAILLAALGVSIIAGVAARWISWVDAGMAATLAWVAFKHGCVRADGSHARIFFTFIILVCAFLFAQVRRKTVRPAILGMAFSVFALFALQATDQITRVWSLWWWWPVSTLGATAQLLNPRQLKKQLDQASDIAFRNSPINSFLPTINRSRTLIFPTDLSFGSRGDFQLVPLFGTQGYMAYTSYLDRNSAEKIRNASPPINFVVFEWQAIDGRNLLVDVPQIWTALFSGFVPASPELETFLLRPRSSVLPIDYSDAGRQSCPTDTWIPVPNSATPIALSLELSPTALGHLVTTAYRLNPIRLSLETRSGRTSDIRLAPDTVSSPFPLNYLPLTSVDLAALWRDNVVRDPVVRFRLTGPGLDWRRCDGFHFHNVTGTPIHLG